MSRSSNLPNRLSVADCFVKQHRRMLDECKFSLTPSEGEQVIITSGSNREEREALDEHSGLLASDPSRQFFGARILRQPSLSEVETVVINPEVSSIAFIGDGNFGTLHLASRGPDTVERLTWYGLARIATNLKLGAIEERTCSMILNPTKEVRVALSSFIVADQTEISGTVGKSFATHHGFQVFNEHLGPIYEHSVNSVNQLRQPIGFEL